ncbi:MAG: hypothetical protein JKX69_04510 [Rhodobacteraceae bacterium]|nr:hypothetical protein [Paracoccaceae bacterium]
MTMIHRAADLPALIQALDARMGSLVILPLTSRAGRAAGRVILRAKKGGRAEAQLLAPFILHDGSHGDGGNKFSTAAERILKFGGKLSL